MRPEEQLLRDGYPAYTTTVGWLGYSDQVVKDNCRRALLDGYTRFKAKVGSESISRDRERLRLIRDQVGESAVLAVDANQKWEVEEAIAWMKQLRDFNLLWIEEPTAPDDVLGHLRISQALAPHGIGVATGEQAHNRILFKQLLQSGAMQFCQVDATRLAGLNEVLAVLLMAAKFKVPVCPHAGGIGLCNYVQHIAAIDFIAVSGSLKERMTEFCDHLHEHFSDPPVMRNGAYVLPRYHAYLGSMKADSMSEYEFPDGGYWRSRAAAAKQK